jgi:hypothetical protein
MATRAEEIQKKEKIEQIDEREGYNKRGSGELYRNDLMDTQR